MMIRSTPRIATLAALLLLAAGCGTSQRQEITEDHFFPPDPADPPRYQYLRSFNGSLDFDDSRPFLDYLVGDDVKEAYLLQKPYSVAAWRGRVYVSDSFGLRGVNVFDLANRQFYVLGKGEGVRLQKPMHVFIDEEGFKYVSDQGRKQVVVFGPDDNFARVYGDGRSFRPLSCVAHGDEVFILDIANDTVPPPEDDPEGEPTEVRRDQILVLDRESGRPLRRIGRDGSPEEGFHFATHLALDRLGHIYVTDFLNHRVVKLDREGNVLLSFGRYGDQPGDFSKMKDLAVDRNGFIYVVDTDFNAVQAYDAEGKPLTYFGGARAPRGAMNMPAGIWIDYESLEYFREYIHPEFEAEYLIFVCNQLSLENKVTVYAHGRRRGVEYPPDDGITTLEEAETRPLWQFPVVSAQGDAAPRTSRLAGGDDSSDGN